MSFELKWYDKEFDNYYVGGAVFCNFNAEKEHHNLMQFYKEKAPIFVNFIEVDGMLTIDSFSKEDPKEETHFYELDEGLLELFETYQNNSDIPFLIGILAVQYFEFDTLASILELTEEEIENLSQEDKEIIKEIRSELSIMDDDKKKEFLENELFFYEKKDLDSFMQKHS